MSIRITIEYETIVSWAQRRGAIPSTFRGIERPWPLKFSTGPGDPSLVEIGWDKFFAEFEKADLAFVYRNTGPSGELDDYYEFVKRAAVPELMAASTLTMIEQAI